MLNICSYSDDEEEDNNNDDNNVNNDNNIINCEICNNSRKQYKCPRCSRLTCSLNCCKQHKMETGCNGQRDRTEFINISKFNDKNLRNDYHFLEDVLQTKGSAERTLIHINSNNSNNNNNNNSMNNMKKKNIKQNTNPFENINNNSIRINDNNNNNIQNLQPYQSSVKKLVKAARKRDISMILFSTGMLKRQQNTTQYNSKLDIISWRIHVVFIVNENYNIASLLKPDIESKGEQEMNIADGSLLSVTINNIDENKTINDIINLYFEARPGNSVQRHALRPLRLRQDNIRVFMHKIPSAANAPIFIDINRYDTITNALKGKTIIEYPTLFIGVNEDVTTLRFLIEEENIQGMKRHFEEIVDTIEINESSSKSKRVCINNNSNNNQIEDDDIDEDEDDNNNNDINNNIFNNNIFNNSNNDDDDIDPDEEKEFIKSLNEFSNKDINALREFIASSE